MSYIRYVIGVDPSGAYDEGKGTTGLAVYDRQDNKIVSIATVSATDYDCIESYFWANLERIVGMSERFYPSVIMIEDFLVYSTHATTFTNSRMETCQLIGFLKAELYSITKQYYLEPASAVKTRWTNKILAHSGYVEAIGASCYHELIKERALYTHELDAIRHAVHCGRFVIK